MMGMTLNNIMAAQDQSAGSKLSGKDGWGKAKSVILIFLQGGPSHIDLWDPKENAPDDVRSLFKTIPAKVPGMERLLPDMDPITFPIWLVTHRELHSSARIRLVYDLLADMLG